MVFSSFPVPFEQFALSSQFLQSCSQITHSFSSGLFFVLEFLCSFLARCSLSSNFLVLLERFALFSQIP